MKSPEYVATVTSVYRKYLDSFTPLEKADEDRLKKIFVRGDGFTKAYFSEKNTPEIMNYSMSNDNLSARADEEVLKEARQSFREGIENKKIPVDAVLSLIENEPAKLSLTDGKYTVSCEGISCEKAIKSPLSSDRAETQISKMGSTPFELHKFDFITDGTSTLPVSALNSLRREATELLSEKRTQVQSKKIYPFSYPLQKGVNTSQVTYIAAEISSAKQFDAVEKADRILIPIHLWESITPNEKCFVVLPEVVTDTALLKRQLSAVPSSYGVYASSLGMLTLAKETGHKAYADWGTNIYNSVTATRIKDIAEGITLSPEVSLQEAKAIISASRADCEVVCYGYQRVMTSRACLIRGITGKCDCKKPVTLTDKTGAQFVISGNTLTHLNSVYNSRPTFMADKLKEIKKSGVSGMRLCFTTENAEYISKIIAMYKGQIPAEKPPVYTRGYLLK